MFGWAGRRGVIVIVFLALAALTAAAWSQQFVSIRLRPQETTAATLDLTGAQLASVLGLLVLTAVIAFLIAVAARGMSRYLAATACLMLAVGETATVVVVMTNPVALARATIAGITGIYDSAAQRELIVDLTFTSWVVVALLASCLQALVAVRVLFLIPRWTAGASRYERRGGRVPGPRSDRQWDVTEVWDTLSDGRDPTVAQRD